MPPTSVDYPNDSDGDALRRLAASGNDMKAHDFSAFRQTGDSWRVVTVDTPQPATLEPVRP